MRIPIFPQVAICIAIGIALVPIGFPTTSHAAEEPQYKVSRKLGDDMEVRQYAPYAVAEVVVAGPAADAGSRAFPILAGYIFGKNRRKEKFAMTAPVTQAVSTKIETTAQVTQSSAPGSYVVQFVLPKGITKALAPEPIDPQVTVRDITAFRVAVITFSGFWSASNYDKHLARLRQTLSAAGMSWAGEPVYSRYNPPFTPWFLRRNEIWLPLP